MKKEEERNGVLKNKVFEGILIVTSLNIEGQHRNKEDNEKHTYFCFFCSD